MAAMDISSLNKQRSMPSLMPSSLKTEGDDESILGGLTCPVCCEAYSDLEEAKCPRILSNCGHTLCSGCIATWAKKHDNNQRRVSCPLCCTNTNLPNDQIEDLPKNFAILDVMAGASMMKRRQPPYTTDGSFYTSFNGGDYSTFEEKYCEAECSGNLSPAKLYCFDCSIFMCPHCNDSVHSKVPNEKEHDVKSLMELQKCQLLQAPQCSIRNSSGFLTFRSNSDSSVNYCKTHREPMKIFCETDNTTICIYCQLHGDHKGHNCVLIDDIATLKREALQGLKEELNTKQSQCVIGFNLCKKAEEDIEERKVQLKIELDKYFDFLYSALEARKKQLQCDLNEMTEEALKILSAQSSSLSEASGTMKSKMGEIDLFCQNSNFDMFQKGDSVFAGAQETLQAEVDSHPLVTDGIVLTFNDQTALIDSILEYGGILTAPGRVRDLKVQVRDENKMSVLMWKRPKSGGKVDNYRVEYSGDDRKFKHVHTGLDLACQLHGSLSNNFVHKYRVMAENEAGRGPYSPPLTVKTGDASFHWDPVRKSPCITLSNDNLTASVGEHMTGFVTIGGNKILSTGRHYWEIKLDRFGHQSTFRRIIVGVVSADAVEWEKSHAFISSRCCPLCKHYWAIACGTGKKLSHQTARRGSTYLRGKQFNENDQVGVLLDLENHFLEFYKNGESLGQAFDNVDCPVIPIVSMRFQKTVTLSFPAMPEDVPNSSWCIISK